MGLNEILANLPSLVSSIVDKIIIINNSENKLYLVDYDGEKIHVSTPNKVDYLNELISDEDVKVKINSNFDNRCLVNGNLVVTKNIGAFKLVMLTNFEEKVDTEELVVENKPLILIADDSEVITKFFTKIFKDEYEVIVAKDGEEAIKLVDDNKDTLLAAFIDLNMPKKDGYDVLDYFTANGLFSSIPVSIISGEDTKDGISRATSVDGVIDMLQKPFSSEAAHAIVEKTISFSERK